MELLLIPSFMLADWQMLLDGVDPLYQLHLQLSKGWYSCAVMAAMK
jgi:hypothetical protein